MAQPAFGNNGKDGIAALAGVLVVGVIAVTSVTLVLASSSRLGRTALSLRRGAEAREAARACAEEALLALQSDPEFLGGGSATVGQATCAFAVTDAGAEARRIEATGQSGSGEKRIVVETDRLLPTIHVSSWREN